MSNPKDNGPLKCSEIGCDGYGLYVVRGKAFCSAHRDKAIQAAKIEAAEFDQMLWGSRKVKP